MLGKGVGDAIAGHGKPHRTAGGLRARAGKELRQAHEGVASVEVIGIDDDERTPHRVGRAPDGVAGAPRLGAAGRRGEERIRKSIELLEDVVDRHPLLETSPHALAKHGFEVAPDDEDHAVKPRAQRVEDGVVEERFAVGPDRFDLLGAAEAAAHAGSHDEERGFHLRGQSGDRAHRTEAGNVRLTRGCARRGSERSRRHPTRVKRAQMSSASRFTCAMVNAMGSSAVSSTRGVRSMA